ncbi:fungal hydrophobin [Coprinopsis marcescibilis]|uniref:Hydrophobin n=1 Tax=Coprinopsis marcescibilis TaxID=230819 RepID=A0A5C3KGS4_COPMA|nr:fungal hydrophobin [Coprinopsis marcescibilis]
MMHRLSSIIVVFLLALIASASVIVERTDPVTPAPPTPPQCTTGPIQCCNSVQQSNAPVVGVLAALLGINVGSITGLVGITCSPLTVIGIGGNNCNAQTVCCNNNTFNGIIAIGCTPINIGL